MKVSDLIKGTGSTKTVIATVFDVDILDASSSMSGAKYKAACSGIEEGHKSLLTDDSGVIFRCMVVEFSGSYNSLGNYMRTTGFFYPADLSRIWRPAGAGGMTPLYATIGQVIENVLAEKKKEDKALIKIFTDGGENTSRGSKWAAPRDLKALIDRVEKEDNFTVTFVGTEFDVATVVDQVGINYSNTLSHDNTSRGISESYTKSANSRLRYAKSVAGGQSVNCNFFSEEDRQKTVEEKREEVKKDGKKA